MIQNYSRPQSLIRQFLETTPDSPVQAINAFILGPQYFLKRYTNSDERATITGSIFNSSGQVLPYEGSLDTYKVDKDFVRIFGEDLEATLASYPSNGTNKFNVLNLSSPNKIRLRDGSNNGVAVVGSSRDSALKGRDVKVGDIVRVSFGGEEVVRRVTGTEKELLPSTFGSNSDKDDGEAANSSLNPINTTPAKIENNTAPTGWTVDVVSASAWNGLVTGAVFGNRYGERYTITVTTPGGEDSSNTSDVRVRIRSASGLYSADNVGVTWSTDHYAVTHASLGGLTVKIEPASGTPDLSEGQQFAFTIIGEYERLDMSDNLVISGNYSGPSDTTYLITVIKGTASSFGGAVVRVSDINGVDNVREFTITSGASYPLGTYGLTFSFDESVAPAQGGLRTGDVYSVGAVASKASGVESIVVLNGSAVNVTGWADPDIATNNLSVEFGVSYSGEIEARRNNAPNLAWTAGDVLEGVTVEKDLSLYVAERTSDNWVPFKDGVGKLFVSYRALVPASANSAIKRFASQADIASAYGKIDPDNTLAYGLAVALQGSQGKPVYGISLTSDDVSGYTTALRKAENSDEVYAFAALTYDEDIQSLVKAHVNDMSTESKKLWRRAYHATKAPGEYGYVTSVNGSPVLATVTGTGGNNTRVTTSMVDFISAGVEPGDLFRTNYSTDVWGDTSYDEYTVLSVTGENELVLSSGPSLPISTAQKFELWKPDNGNSQSRYVAQRSATISDRRNVNVFIDTPLVVIDGQTVETEVYYVAANIAGIRSAAPVQQGLTYTEVDFVFSAPNMYTKYTQSELDYAAANGTFIVTQEKTNGPVFIRHQLTTETNGGILFYEDSVGVNFDSICYALKDVATPFIGRRNATRKTLVELENAVYNTLNDLTTVELSLENIGPQIISIVGDSVQVSFDPLRSNVTIRARVELPTPINTVVIEVTGTVPLSLSE